MLGDIFNDQWMGECCHSLVCVETQSLFFRLLLCGIILEGHCRVRTRATGTSEEYGQEGGAFAGIERRGNRNH